MYDYYPESQVLVHMSPTSYLRYCSKSYARPEWDKFVEELRQSLQTQKMLDLRERFLTSQPVDALFLDVDPNTGEIHKHMQEGQHRACLAQELGIAFLPVLIYARVRGLGLVDETESPGCLTRLRDMFDENPALSAQVAAELASERSTLEF